MSRRIRTVNGITVDKKVVRNDIKLAAKVITNLDTRWQLWMTGETNGKSENVEQVDKLIYSKLKIIILKKISVLKNPLSNYSKLFISGS